MIGAGISWSATRLEDNADDAARDLAAALTEYVPGTVLHLRGHRWRYARAATRIPAPCAYDEGLRLGVAGDGFAARKSAPAATRAVLSGQALAARIIAANRKCRWWLESQHVLDMGSVCSAQNVTTGDESSRQSTFGTPSLDVSTRVPSASGRKRSTGLARLTSNLVPVREQLVELTPRDAGAKQAAHGAKRQLVLDVVGQRALLRPALGDGVAM